MLHSITASVTAGGAIRAQSGRYRNAGRAPLIALLGAVPGAGVLSPVIIGGFRVDTGPGRSLS